MSRLWFPAFAAAARMVMQRLCVEIDLDLVGRTQALQGPPAKFAAAGWTPLSSAG